MGFLFDLFVFFFTFPLIEWMQWKRSTLDAHLKLHHFFMSNFSAVNEHETKIDSQQFAGYDFTWFSNPCDQLTISAFSTNRYGSLRAAVMDS